MRIIFCNISAHQRWRRIENYMKDKLINFRNDLSFVTFCEMYFYKGGKSLKSDWVGIIHDPPDTQKYDSSRNIFRHPRFKESLKCCKHLFTMSNKSTEWAIRNVKQLNYNIPVTTLRHPLPEMSSEFDLNKFKENSNKHIIQIGNWLRKTYSIYLLNVSNDFQKSICPWNSRMTQELTQTCQRDHIKLTLENTNSVKHFNKLSDSEYSKLFESNIIHLNLYSSTVNNVILEAIKANTPIIVNRLDSIEEYLTKEYPLFYTKIDEIKDLLTYENIKRGHEYLKKLDKSILSLDYFINSIKIALSD